uniref:uncharacterized protein n=1 Tax=Semicossyphus pulcher TaxID=241346 RepID=UPI0037E98D8A
MPESLLIVSDEYCEWNISYSPFVASRCFIFLECPTLTLISSRRIMISEAMCPSQAPQPKRRNVSCRSPSHAEPTNPSHSSSDSFLVSTLQALNKSMSNIDARLRALENASSATSSSATTSANSVTSMLDVTTPSQPSTITRIESSAHSLATAVPAPILGGIQNITSQLLSLLGHLNFAMRVIPQGRSFISRLLEMSSSVHNLYDVISLDKVCRSDLSFWSLLLEHWNSITFFYDDLVHSSDSLKFFTDAAPSVGFGGFFQGQWFADHWPPAFSEFDQSSALYEIYPVAVACHVWGPHWKRKHISVLCDNQAVVSMINRGRSSSKDIMPFLRSITWSSITHNFIITARQVPGHYNKLADSLSHFNVQIFRSICPEASPFPIQVLPLHQLTLF